MSCPAGIDIAGIPAKFTGTVNMSFKYIDIGSLVFSPTLKAEFQSVSNYKKQRLSTPLQRGSSTSEICATIKYFVDTSSVSGQLICVDGGQNLQAIKKTEEIDQ